MRERIHGELGLEARYLRHLRNTGMVQSQDLGLVSHSSGVLLTRDWDPSSKAVVRSPTTGNGLGTFWDPGLSIHQDTFCGHPRVENMVKSRECKA